MINARGASGPFVEAGTGLYNRLGAFFLGRDRRFGKQEKPRRNEEEPKKIIEEAPAIPESFVVKAVSILVFFVFFVSSWFPPA